MGEIRSTLDIIMEKTDGLTMTEEEKRKFKQRELSAKAKGFIQKYVDGALDLERAKMEAKAAGYGERNDFHRALIEESRNWMEPGQDNEAILKLLDNITGIDVQTIGKVLTDFKDRMEEERNARENTLRTELRDKGIWGKAVIPNIEADTKWRYYLEGLEAEFRKKIKEVFERFLPC